MKKVGVCRGRNDNKYVYCEDGIYDNKRKFVQGENVVKSLIYEACNVTEQKKEFIQKEEVVRR